MITCDKTLTKKLLTVRPEKVTRRKKREKKRTTKAIEKLLALNANAKTYHLAENIGKAIKGCDYVH